MNYMIYAKHRKEKKFGAVNLTEGTIGVGLMFATIILDLDRAKDYTDRLADTIPDYAFQVRGAGTSRVFYAKGPKEPEKDGTAAKQPLHDRDTTDTAPSDCLERKNTWR